jgi:uncharacterized protein YndB with AHSA1/START domain
MIKVERSVDIRKPLAQVFDYSLHKDNYSKWQGEGTMEMIQGEDNVVGSRYKESFKFMGRDMNNTVEITAYKKNELWASKVIEGPILYATTMVYAAIPDGTRLTLTIEGEVGGFFKLAEGLVKTSIEKDVEKALSKLKALLEK